MFALGYSLPFSSAYSRTRLPADGRGESVWKARHVATMSCRIHCVDRTSIWRFRANFSVQTGVDLSDRYTRIKSYQVFPCRMAPTGIYMYYTRRKIEGNKTPKCNRYLRVSYVLRCDVTSREVKEARRPYTCSRPSAFEENRTRNQGRFINNSGAHKQEIKRK